MFLKLRAVPVAVNILRRRVIIEIMCTLVAFILIGDFVILSPMALFWSANLEFSWKLGLVLQMCNAEMIWTVVTMLFVLSFSEWLSLLVLNHYLTLPLPLPFANPDDGFKNKAHGIVYLPDALTAPNDTLLKHLAIRRLEQVTSDSDVVSGQLLALSFPGGHPRNWTAIFAECQAMLRALLDDIKVRDSVQRDARGVGESVAPFMAVDALSTQQLLTVPPQLRRIRGACGSLAPSNRGPVKVQVAFNVPASIAETMSKFITVISSTVPFQYLMTEPDGIVGEKHSNAFRYVDLYVCILKALTNVGVLALAVDAYGVFRRDMPALLSLELDIYAALEQYSRLRKQLVLQAHNRPILPSMRLQNALRESLVRLHGTYGDSLKNLRLSADHMSQLDRIVGGADLQ
jgi:hypothetical protein